MGFIRRKNQRVGRTDARIVRVVGCVVRHKHVGITHVVQRAAEVKHVHLTAQIIAGGWLLFVAPEIPSKNDCAQLQQEWCGL